MAKKVTYKALRPLHLDLEPGKITTISNGETFKVDPAVFDEARLAGLAVKEGDEEPDTLLLPQYEHPEQLSLEEYVKKEEDRRPEELKQSAEQTQKIVDDTKAHMDANEARIKQTEETSAAILGPKERASKAAVDESNNETMSGQAKTKAAVKSKPTEVVDLTPQNISTTEPKTVSTTEPEDDTKKD